MVEQVLAVGGKDAKGVLELLEIPRRETGPKDVSIKIKYCGMCHSDLHHTKQEWGKTLLPSVPGHEIVGVVDKVGPQVTKFKVGDVVGVGCFVNSCRNCDECKQGLIQYCSGKRDGGLPGLVGTYGAKVLDGTSHTHGGYSQKIVVDQDYVLSIPASLHDKLDRVAPLLCAGITVWSPMVHYGVKKGSSVAVLGLGGLGHMAVKFAAAMGCHVTVLARTHAKNAEAIKLGAHKIVSVSSSEELAAAARSFDFIVDTVSAKHDLGTYLNLLRTDGTLIIVGGVPEPLELRTFSLIPRRLRIGGSLVGGIKETQEMIDFCGQHQVVSEIELVPVTYSNKAWERMLKSDVKFRFVLDIEKSLTAGVKIDV
ncbi:alcohol dehydrogenase [Gorgonomyces haynaldii]|nr:alcohol dehydrogenase [Gorgonomyces haynaldii]